MNLLKKEKDINDHVDDYLVTRRTLLQQINRDRKSFKKKLQEVARRREQILTDHREAIRFSEAIELRLPSQILDHLTTTSKYHLSVGPYYITKYQRLPNLAAVSSVLTQNTNYPGHLYLITTTCISPAKRLLSLPVSCGNPPQPHSAQELLPRAMRNWSSLVAYKAHLPPEKDREALLQILDLANKKEKDIKNLERNI